MRVGIVGGGQLARMLVLAGVPMGLQFRVLDPAEDACAGAVAPLITARYDASQALAELAAWADVVTFDFENVPEAAARLLAEQVAVYPPPAALASAQDRLIEKDLFNELAIPTAPYWPVSNAEQLQLAINASGSNALLKTRQLGYDGKGQQRITARTDVAAISADLDAIPRILESWIDFQTEVSLLSIRARDGSSEFYPLVENVHRDGILRISRAPFTDDSLTRQAQEHARKLLDRLDYVGCLAIEFFVVDGRLIANEMAPRVHNSGHWTIEGAHTSQFENHLRAVVGWPLGTTAARGYSAMINFIGVLGALERFMAMPMCHYHNYGKMPRPGRKIGHATLCTANIDDRERRLAELAEPEDLS